MVISRMNASQVSTVEHCLLDSQVDSSACGGWCDRRAKLAPMDSVLLETSYYYIDNTE